MLALTSRLGILAIAAAVSAGCGLISEDVTDIRIGLSKSFTIDTSSYQIDEQAAMVVTQTSCASMPDACAQAAMAACPEDCTGVCAASNTCELDIDVSLYQQVDLQNDEASLRSLDKATIDVEIESVKYLVGTNTLNVATPAMKVFIAPMSVMEIDDPAATEIGTIPAIAAGATNATEIDIELTAAGRTALTTIMRTYKTPFNILVGTTLTVAGTTPVPEGRLDATVRIVGTVGL